MLSSAIVSFRILGLFFLSLLAAIVPRLAAQDCSGVVQMFRGSVVSIEVKNIQKETGAVVTVHGTGFIVDQEGNVLTSKSLFTVATSNLGIESLAISGALGSSEQGVRYPMELLTSSDIGEIAVLRFRDTSHPWTPIQLGDPWSVPLGQIVCFMGFPFNQEFVTKPGAVTGKGATKGWWYSDIPYNAGAAGAPIFDARNQKLIGMVGVDAEIGNDRQKQGFIVPVNLAFPLLLQFANVEIKGEAARALAAGLRGLQVPDDHAAVAPPDSLRPPEGKQLEEEGLSVLELVWPTAKIFVCWENPSPNFQSEMLLVQQEVANTWQRESRLRFVGWQKCASKNSGLRIKIDDSAPHTKALGRKLDGLPDGIVVNFTFANWSTSCQSTKDYCIRAIAGHLFGHAIGFGHTQNRPDAPEQCRQLAQGETLSWQLTPYDPNSIMNYCNPKFYNDGNLSQLDIEALHVMYGAQ
jgi:S1-C subfamily serine protease